MGIKISFSAFYMKINNKIKRETKNKINEIYQLFIHKIKKFIYTKNNI